MEEWLLIDPNETSRTYLHYIAQEDPKLLSTLFPHKEHETAEQRIEFGTAGLRAAFGAGPLRMNDVTVMQTAQGLMRQLEADFGRDALKSRGIVIGYDHRASKPWGLSSRRFALVAACVFLAEGYNKIYLMDDLCPTPFVPFAIQQHGCVAGFMMTASHNPKDDAGFKVYWENACQLVSPKDDQVTKQILSNLAINHKATELLNKSEKEIFNLCGKNAAGLVVRTADAYAAVAKQKLCRFHSMNQDSNNGKRKKICYTAMHGVGLPFEQKLFKAFGHPQFVVVPSQAEPDAEFPTVPFPNPEEKGALTLAQKYAEENGCELVLANDPDADRLAIAEFDNRTNRWVALSGDEIAMLLAWWELEIRDRQQKSSKSAKTAMVVSAVSSGFLKAMGDQRDCQVFEALTGFKWIGTKALQLRQQGYQVLFSYEEAIGFCVGDVICDKDGITAGAVFAEMYNQLTLAGETCLSKLEALRKQFGYFLTSNGYIKTAEPKHFFVMIRNKGRYAQVVGNSKAKFKVKSIRDLDKQTYLDTSEADGIPKLPFASNMITFYLEPLVKEDSRYEIRVTLRASGTEPKLKYYVEANGKDPHKTRKYCDSVVESAVLDDLLKVVAPKSALPTNPSKL